MKSSLIITTYNWHTALKVVILSALKQSILPSEIIIADDGSDEKTKKIIEALQSKTKLPIIHYWQKDKGFRAAKSRNKAIAMAKYDYIIMIDGDMILDKNFINNHLKNRQKSYFIQGSRVLLGEGISNKILNMENLKMHLFSTDLKNRKNLINNNLLAKIFSKKSTKISGIKTCNMSFWKRDIIQVNGFNEEFIGWGREDSEFVIRLYNIGVKRLSIKFNCNAYHLHHLENNRKSLAKNDEILQNTINNKLTICQNGINKYL